MGTTKPAVAMAALDALSQVQVPWAVLHRESDVAEGRVDSDVDVAADINVAALRDWQERLGRMDLEILAICQYDVGSRSFFLRDTTGGGAQIDLIDAAARRGRLGLDTRALLDERGDGRRWPVPDTTDQILYLLAKACTKRQDQRFAREILNLPAGNSADVRGRIDRLFRPAVAARMKRAIAVGRPDRFPRRPVLPWARWAAHRLLTRTGVWWHSGDRANLEGARRSLQGLLVDVHITRVSPTPAFVWQWLTSTRKPHALLTYGPVPRWPRPDRSW